MDKAFLSIEIFSSCLIDVFSTLMFMKNIITYKYFIHYGKENQLIFTRVILSTVDQMVKISLKSLSMGERRVKATY